MRRIDKLLCNALIVSFVLLLAVLSSIVRAQERMTIEANARGTSTQLGKLHDIHIYIEQYSTPDDRKAIIDAFTRSGQQGVRDVLEDMKPKGRVRFSSGGVGNDVKYIAELPSENGRRFRLITDRNIAFAELHNSTRSREYEIGAIDLILTPDGKGSGTLLPACKIKLNKQKQIEVETYQNPWKLSVFRVSKD